MTFEEFQATGVDVDDLGEHGCMQLKDVPGRRYEGGLYLERNANGSWHLDIERSSWDDTDLEHLEHLLYEFGDEEGVLK